MWISMAYLLPLTSFRWTAPISFVVDWSHCFSVTILLLQIGNILSGSPQLFYDMELIIQYNLFSSDRNYQMYTSSKASLHNSFASIYWDLFTLMIQLLVQRPIHSFIYSFSDMEIHIWLYRLLNFQCNNSCFSRGLKV